MPAVPHLLLLRRLRKKTLPSILGAAPKDDLAGQALWKSSTIALLSMKASLFSGSDLTKVKNKIYSRTFKATFTRAKRLPGTTLVRAKKTSADAGNAAVQAWMAK